MGREGGDRRRRLQRDCAPVSHNLCKWTGQDRPLEAGVTEAAAHTPARPWTAGEPSRALNRAGWRQGSGRRRSGREAGWEAALPRGAPQVPGAPTAGHPHKATSSASGHSFPLEAQCQAQAGAGSLAGSSFPLSQGHPRHANPRQSSTRRLQRAPPLGGSTRGRFQQRAASLQGVTQPKDRRAGSGPQPHPPGCPRLTSSLRETRSAGTTRNGPSRRPRRSDARARGREGPCARPPPVCGARAMRSDRGRSFVVQPRPPGASRPRPCPPPPAPGGPRGAPRGLLKRHAHSGPGDSPRGANSWEGDGGGPGRGRGGAGAGSLSAPLEGLP